MSASEQAPAVDSAARNITRRLIEDQIDPAGAPCVALIDAETGAPVRIVNEGHDDYAAEVALAENEQRESRDSLRSALARSAYAKELLAEAATDLVTAQKSDRFAPKVPDLNAPRPQWIVKNVVPEKSLVVLYGRHGTGKSTLATELSVCVARGMPWHGRKTKQGAVVYIASENAHGSRSRLDAVLKHQGIALADLGENYLEIIGRPHLLKPDDVKELIRELKPFRPTAVVWDTFARAVAGSDENAVKEMMIAVENAQTIINETGASVILIAHSGKDAARGVRGSSALPAAADTEIVVERPDETENFRTVRLGKQRDAQDYCRLFDFELQTVELGRDEDGDAITSTVVHEVEEPPESTLTEIKLNNSPIRRAVRGVLGSAMRPVPVEELVAKVKDQIVPPEPGKRDRRTERIRDTINRMAQDREVCISGDLVSLLTPEIPFPPVAEGADLVTSKEQDKTHEPDGAELVS